jgi:hypothetical protein
MKNESRPTSSVFRIPKIKVLPKLSRNLCSLAKKSIWHQISTVSTLPKRTVRGYLFIYVPSLFPRDMKDEVEAIKEKVSFFHSLTVVQPLP